MAVTKRDKERKEKKMKSVKDWAKQQGTKARAHLNLPEGVEEWRPEPGKHEVDFIPFIVKGTHNPHADEGEPHYERTYYAHRIAGPDGRKQLQNCLYKNWDKKCSTCVLMNSPATNRDLAKDLFPTTRHLWLVNDKPGDPKNPLKVYDTNHQNRGQGFGELMVDLMNSLDDDEDPFDLENGKTFRLTIKEQTFPGGKFNAVTRIDLVPRKKQYKADFIESCPCLDDCLVELSEEELDKLLMYGETADSNGEAPKASGKSKAKSKEEDDDEDEDQDEDEDDEEDEDEEEDTADDGRKFKDVERIHPKKGETKGKVKEKTAKECGIKVGDFVTHPSLGECKVLKISPDGTSLTVEDEDKDVESGVAPEDCKLVPVKGKTPAKGKGKKNETVERDEESEDDEDQDSEDEEDESEDDDDDFEEDEEDEPEPVKKAGRKVGGKAKGNKGGK